jgi:hypothetical protein
MENEKTIAQLQQDIAAIRQIAEQGKAEYNSIMWGIGGWFLITCFGWWLLPIILIPGIPLGILWLIAKICCAESKPPKTINPELAKEIEAIKEWNEREKRNGSDFIDRLLRPLDSVNPWAVITVSATALLIFVIVMGFCRI